MWYSGQAAVVQEEYVALQAPTEEAAATRYANTQPRPQPQLQPQPQPRQAQLKQPQPADALLAACMVLA